MAGSGDDDADDSTQFHGDKEGASPLDSPRRCTDCFWLVLFLIGSGGVCAAWSFAAQRGDPRWLSALPDSDGQLCGEDARGHLLFVCQASAGGLGWTRGLDLSRRVCVDECPRSEMADGVLATACPWAGAVYPSQAVAGLACLPAAAELRQMVGSNPYFGNALLVSEIGRAWPLLVGAATSAFFLSILFFFLMEHCTVYFMFWGFISLIAGSAVLGFRFIHTSSARSAGQTDGFVDFAEMDWDFALGVVCCMFAMILLCLFICHWEPSLVLEPLLSLMCRVVVMLPLLVGFLWLVSCGRRTAHAAASDEMSRPFLEFDSPELALLVFYVFMLFWIAELCHAVSVFVVAYTVEVWYFEVHQGGKGKSKGDTVIAACCGGLLRAYCDGMENHLGTLACGALVIAVLRPLRLVFGVVARAASDSENPVGVCLAHFCGCCLGCFAEWVEFVNKNAYMDVAMNSTGFCTAARHAAEVLSREAVAEVALNVALPVLQIAGLGGIAACSAGVSFWLARCLPMFADPSSDYYIRDVASVTTASAAVGFLVAWPFLHIFETVADTILYCIAAEAVRKPDEPDIDPPCGGYFACFGGGRSESERLLG